VFFYETQAASQKTPIPTTPLRNPSCFGCAIKVQEPKIKLKKKDATVILCFLLEYDARGKGKTTGVGFFLS